MQQVALAGSIGAAAAAAAVIGAAGSTATPAAASHSAVGPHWLGAASASSTLRLHADATGSSSGSTGAGTSSGVSAPTSTAAGTASAPSTSTAEVPRTRAVDDEPEEVDISAAPGPCTQDDVAASRWSTRVTINNPKDAGALDYLAIAVSYYDDSENITDLPHSDPVHLDAGETGSVVLTGPSDYFPDAIVVGGGISPDGQTVKAVGGIDVLNEQDFLKVAKVCGNTTPTPDPGYEDPTSTEVDSGSSGYDGDPAETKTVTATVTVTKTQTVQVERPGMGEPPTPSPITTRLPVAG